MSDRHFHDPPDWQIVARSSEVTASPLAVRLQGSSYVLFRDSTGVCRALLDRCAHRRALLSNGRLTAGFFLECPYHGWRYDGDGICREIPNLSASERVPENFRVPAFPVAEAEGFIFLWSAITEPTGALPLCPSEGSAVRNQAIQGQAIQDQTIRGQTVQGQTVQGRWVCAFPAALYVDALLDCPSAVVAFDKFSIIDNHRFGDPMVEKGRIVVLFAACPSNFTRSGTVIADYPFMLRIDAPLGQGPVFLTLSDMAGRVAVKVSLGIIERDTRITELVWVRSGTLAFQPRGALDADRLAGAEDYMSRFRQAARHGLAAAAA